jgi:hypothetical protein
VERKQKQEADEAAAAVCKKRRLERKGIRRRHTWLMLGASLVRFFLKSFSKKLAVGKSWLCREAGG